MTARNNILLHKDELKDVGLEIMPLEGLPFIDKELHRDDHYMFILLQSGRFVCEIDFNTIEIQNASLLYAAPGQVQHYVQVENTKGWLLLVNPDLVSAIYRTVFDTFLNVSQYAPLAQNDLVFSTAAILQEWKTNIEKHENVPLSIGQSLLDSVCGMVAFTIQGVSVQHDRLGSSKYSLANRFKQEIKVKFRTIKQVKQYASLLNITPLYLNEVMKEITGFSASYWIQDEIILEAKRLLVFSERDIREIGWELGYDDHAYFSRFFKKHTGITATQFRERKP